MNAIRASRLGMASSALILAGAMALVLMFGLVPAAYASGESSSNAGGEPAAETPANASVSFGAAHSENGWEYDSASNQWSYYQNSAPVKGWLYIGGFWYWFDNEGLMAVGLMAVGLMESGADVTF